LALAYAVKRAREADAKRVFMGMVRRLDQERKASDANRYLDFAVDGHEVKHSATSGWHICPHDRLIYESSVVPYLYEPAVMHALGLWLLGVIARTANKLFAIT
jgi:hypothetical protein